MAIENEEVELVKQAKEGNLVSFEKLVRLYQAQIRNGLALRLNVPEEADDLAQETFIVAFNRLQNFDPNMPFLPWLRGIAFNLLKNYWRKHTEVLAGGTGELELLINQEIDLVLTDADEGHLAKLLTGCIDNLDSEHRQIVHLHYQQSYNIKQLTELYESKHSTMTMRLHRIREQLKQCIQNKLKREAV